MTCGLNYAAGGASTAPAEPRNLPQLQAELETQRNTIDYFNERVSILAKRLEPILLPGVPKAETAKSCPKPPACPVANFVEENTHRLVNGLSFVEELLTRLDV